MRPRRVLLLLRCQISPTTSLDLFDVFQCYHVIQDLGDPRDFSATVIKLILYDSSVEKSIGPTLTILRGSIVKMLWM